MTVIKKIILHGLFIFILFVTSNLYSQGINPVSGKVITTLIKDLSDADPFTQGAAISKIVQYGNQAIDYLTKSLSDKNENVRWCSAIALEKIAPEGEKAIPFLTIALKDKNSNVRWCSAIALGKYKLNAKSAIPELLNLLHDDDRDVRWAAYLSLKKIDKYSFNKAPELSEVVDKLESMIPRLIKEYKVPGISISVIKNNKLTWFKSFGVADAVLKNTVTDKTIFEACSMSKPVFAYLVLKLVEQGKFDLDKPLSNNLKEEFISDEDSSSNMITARMILSHTSGLPNWRKGEEERDGPLPIYFNPGTKFNYSGEGFYYLQRVVESIIKEPIEKYAKRTLFDKLGLESTSFIWTEQLGSQIATGHDASGKCLKRSKYTHANAAYTLYTTADEYAKFISEIMKPYKSDDFSLSEITTREMLKHQVRVDVRDVIDRPGRSLGLFSYRGLGWGIDSTISGNIVYHSGANQTGFRCYSQFNIWEGSGIVIMTNGMNGSDLWSKLISAIGDL